MDAKEKIEKEMRDLLIEKTRTTSMEDTKTLKPKKIGRVILVLETDFTPTTLP